MPNRVTRCAALCLLAWLLSVPAHAATHLSSLVAYSARYDVHYGMFKLGEMERSLESLDGEEYRLSTRMQTSGFASWVSDDKLQESSRFRLVDGWPQPQRYDYRFSRKGRDLDERVEFDWQAMRFRSLRHGEESEHDLPPGAQDRLSYQAALALDLERGLSEFDYDVADRGDVRRVRYRISGREHQPTPWGMLATVKLERLSGDDAERQTSLWLAPALNYLPVKIVQVDGGNKSTATITEAVIDGEPVRWLGNQGLSATSGSPAAARN